MKRIIFILLFTCILIFDSCSQKAEYDLPKSFQKLNSLGLRQNKLSKILPEDIEIEKAFLYYQYTLQDVYPYKDTTRKFQWDKIRERLAMLETIQKVPVKWGILQNYNNKNGTAPLTKKYVKNEYWHIADTAGVERTQSVPLFFLTDSVAPERYGKDGTLVKLTGDTIGKYVKVSTIDFKRDWLVPQKYVKAIADTVVFKKVIFVDVTNQNIAILEKVDQKWLVRSMNPITSGLRKPPYKQATPLGIFVLQGKKLKMIYPVDGSTEIGGFAPYANRFSSGAYLHGIPVDAPRTDIVEFSRTLGTTPRSHMCVRNATSHAKFIYDWASVEQTLIFVLK